MRKLLSLIFILLLCLKYTSADISITPYGAAETVSGSCFLLDTGYEKFIVDCGLFMSDSQESMNFCIPKNILTAKALFLTHAHLDHSGKIPLLIHEGFNGRIYSTKATKKLTLALFKERNCFDLIKRKWFWSKSQYKKAKERNGVVTAHWTDDCRESIKSAEYSKNEIFLKDLCKARNVKFLLCKNCCEKEAEKIADKFITVNYNEEINISDKIKVVFINAGHIPGSASIIFSIAGKKICFSGDLGSGHSKFNGNFEVPGAADLIFMEATYGSKIRKSADNDYNVFRKDLKNALASGMTVWIPAFALNRTQEVLYELKLMQDSGYISAHVPIYSVSPSANAITALYQKELSKKQDNLQDYTSGDWFLDDIYQKESILPRNARLQMIRTYNTQMILFSSSGDMSKGKSQQLVPIMLSDKNVFVMIVNYVAPESIAGLILDGKKPPFAFKKLAAKVKKYNAFSDHADFIMLQKWLSKQKKDTKIYIIHSNKQNTDQIVKLLQEKGWSRVCGAKLGQKLN
ncbi:MAG: MBL fold metallo-hydrolase [Endomicrobium sp.]|jgi:metallo-beta-lactamase family protein|nr:MBL fold metallo-hydrolase [Endomicrobium sp.]